MSTMSHLSLILSLHDSHEVDEMEKDSLSLELSRDEMTSSQEKDSQRDQKFLSLIVSSVTGKG